MSGNMTINSTIKPGLVVCDFVQEDGIIESASVQKGGHLELRGICAGNVIIAAGGSLTVAGTVNGVVRCAGGTAEIDGIAQTVQAENGRVLIRGIVTRLIEAGATIDKAPGAFINGRKID